MKKWRKRLLLGLLIFTGLLAIFTGLTACSVNTRMGALPDPADYAGAANCVDGVFVNLEPAVQPIERRSPGLFGFAKFLFDSENRPRRELPVAELARDSFPEQPEEFAVYWLGHSSLIFELDGVRFMTDPVFGNAAPLPGVVRRYADPPLPRAELPELDFVIISHDHYDHLEYATIRHLAASGVRFVTPLGVGARLQGWGIEPERITELNWGDSAELDGLTVTAQAARHFSGRSLKDRNRTLWASFVIAGREKKIYFGADGGYGSHFAGIGAEHGPFDLVCLEIDAWNDMWPNNHLFPAEIPKVFEEVGGRLLLPIHWGVFELGSHPWDESIGLVVRETEAAGIPMITPAMGEKVVPGVTVTRRWWDEAAAAD